MVDADIAGIRVRIRICARNANGNADADADADANAVVVLERTNPDEYGARAQKSMVKTKFKRPQVLLLC
jgi:hypothetical protein